MKKRHYIIVRLLAFVIAPLVIVFTIFMALRVYGFKKALEDLVEKETKGKYVLKIDNIAVGLDRSFGFDGIAIQTTEALPQGGIYKVIIPAIRLRFGSFGDMLSLKKFDIEELAIKEPEVEIILPDSAHQNRERVNIARQVVQFYPAIEALLKNFDIHVLTIERAALELKKSSRSVMKLALLDLLVTDWDIQKLTDKSQLKLKVAGQGLSLGKASFNFSQIEFNFQKHRLLFSDFELKTVDSLSGSYLNIKGKSLQLAHLDYHDLYTNKRFSLANAKIEQPIITGKLKLKDVSAEHKNKDMVRRLLFETVGECSIDSTQISDASVDLILQKRKDSVTLNIPHIDLLVHTFKVVRDSSRVVVGKVEVNMSRSKLTLRNNLSLSCSKVLFDINRDMTMTDILITDPSKQKKIAAIANLRMSSFKLLVFAFDHKLYAKTIGVDKADLYINTLNTGSGKRIQPLSDLKIDHIYLTNSSLHFADTAKTVTVSGFNADMHDLKYDSHKKLLYRLGTVKLHTATARIKKQHISAFVKGLTFEGRHISVTQIDIAKDSLRVGVKNLSLESDEAVDQNHTTDWKSMTANSVTLRGRLSAESPERSKSTQPLNLNVMQLGINKLDANLLHKKMHVELKGSNISGRNIEISQGQITYETLNGVLSDMLVSTPELKVNLKAASIQLPSEVKCTHIGIEQKSMSVNLAALTVNTVDVRHGKLSFRNASAANLIVNKSDEEILQSDSVVLTDFRLSHDAKVPSVEVLEIHKPIIKIIDQKSEGPKEVQSGQLKEEDFYAYMPNHVTVTPGEIRFSNNKKVTFGKMKFDKLKEELHCSFIAFPTKKANIKLNCIRLTDIKLSIDSIRVDENVSWFHSVGLEDDEINARLYGLAVRGFSVRQVLKKGAIEKLDGSLDYLKMDVKRDKNLPDQPIKTKPLTLEAFLGTPLCSKLNSIHLKDGDIEYTEVSDKTGEAGFISLNNISANVQIDTKTNLIKMQGQADLYNSGHLELVYQTIDPNSFSLKVRIKEFDMTKLNAVVTPLEAIRIKSGYLKGYNLDIIANSEAATGTASISYQDLHLELFKRTEPLKKNVEMGIITFLADEFVIKNKKYNATASVNQTRIKHKSIFNYWIKSSVNGAVNAVKKGKEKKTGRNQ